MRAIVFTLLLAVAQPTVAGKDSCAGVLKGVGFAGGDGHDQEAAVVIKAETERQGNEAQRRWLKCRYPEHHRIGQRLVGDPALCGGKGPVYDVIKIGTANGKELEVWFDRTRYHGKG